MEVRVRFQADVYIEGDTLEEIKEKWEEMPIFCADALEDYGADISETISAMNTENWEDCTKEFLS